MADATGDIPAAHAQIRKSLAAKSTPLDALKSLRGTVQEVLVDGPSQDPAFQWEGRLAGQAPEIDGVVYLRGGGLAPARFERVRITDVEGYELVGEAS